MVLNLICFPRSYLVIFITVTVLGAKSNVLIYLNSGRIQFSDKWFFRTLRSHNILFDIEDNMVHVPYNEAVCVGLQSQPRCLK